MRVAAWSNGSRTYGIRVGNPNRDRYFRRSWSSIEVEIGAQSSVFSLTKGFWRKCPEFRGPQIREWFRERVLVPWEKGHPPAFELVPLGGNRFGLDDGGKR